MLFATELELGIASADEEEDTICIVDRLVGIESGIDVLDIISIVLELSPSQVPNRGSQLSGRQ